MHLLEIMLGHDHWTTRQLMLVCTQLDREAMLQQFPIGPGSLQATFVHMISAVEFWTDQIGGRPGRQYRVGSEATSSIDDLLERHDRAAGEFQEVARAIAASGRLEELMEVTDEGTPFRFTRGTAILHVVMHGMHHRAQVMNMLRQLGVEHEVEGDPISWELAEDADPDS